MLDQELLAGLPKKYHNAIKELWCESKIRKTKYHIVLNEGYTFEYLGSYAREKSFAGVKRLLTKYLVVANER